MAMATEATTTEGCATVDVRAVTRGLRSGAASEAWMAAWLGAAAADRRAFLAALTAQAQGRGASCPGTTSATVSPYKSFIGAHVNAGRPALAIETQGQRQVLSYRELDALTGRLARGWMRAGLKPGAVVAIVVSPGIAYVVSLLTCFRMGLVAAPIPPCGRAWVGRRLKLLSPDGIFAGADAGAFGDTWPAPLLPWVRDDDSTTAGPWPYDAAAPLLRLFSPYAAGPLEPIDVSAGTLLDGARCDALLTFHLDPSDVIAAPGWDAAASQPTLLFAALMAGACWAEIPEASALARPGVFADFAVTVLGVSPPLHERLVTSKDWEAAPLRAWFRHLLDPTMELWDDLIQQAASRGVPSFSVVLAPCAGGAVVFSPPALCPRPFLCWPVPARAHQLTQLGSERLQALAESGLFTPFIDEKPAKGVPAVVLAQHGAAHYFAGCVQVGRAGQVYPEEEVVALVESHPLVKQATAVVTPRRRLGDAHVTLLVFCGPGGADTIEGPSHELRSLIKAGLGAAQLPDRIEWLPLRPRSSDKGIDRAWCRGQYLSGALRAKSSSRMFRVLSQLAEIAELHLGGQA
jgi:hypothetical protein